MSHLNIVKKHTLGLSKARQIAKQWQADGEEKYGLSCEYIQNNDKDLVYFKRSGVSGTLKVTSEAFYLDAKLGFLFSAFKTRIEDEIEQNLNELLG